MCHVDVYECSLYAVNVCCVYTLQEFLILGLRGLWGFTPRGGDRMLRVLIAMHRGFISELCGFRERCVRWGHNWNKQLRKIPMRLLNTSGGKVVYERHSCRQNLWGIIWSSSKWALSICTVVHWEELCCEFLRRIRITKDSEELCQVGIERVHRCTGEGDRIVWSSGGRYSARRA